MKRLSAIIALILFMCAPAWAAKKVALIIGNDAYSEVPALQKAVNDARAVSQTMATIGFDVDLGENLTRRQINDKFSRFLDRIEPGDTAFFFFAGHGIALNGQNILLPVDIPASDSATLVRSEAHVVDDLIEQVKEKGAIVSMFVLDACRNNPFAASGKRSLGGTRGLQVMGPPRGSFVLMSAGSGEEALDRLNDSDGNPNSVFTRELLPLLRTPGLTHVEIAKSVQSKVETMAKTIGHSQQPAFYDQITGNVVLVPNGAAPKPVESAAIDPGLVTPPVATTPGPATEVKPDTALIDWNAVKDTRSIAVLRQFIADHPGSRYAGYAQAMIDEMQAAQKQSAPKAEPKPQREQPQREPDPPRKPKETQTARVEPPAQQGGLATRRVRSGWYVVMGSFPHSQAGKARQRVNMVTGRGYRVSIIDTDDYSGLTGGLYAVVMGPYSREGAQAAAERAKSAVGDAYVRQVR